MFRSLSVLISFPFDILSGRYFSTPLEKSVSSQVLTPAVPRIYWDTQQQVLKGNDQDLWDWVVPMGAAPPWKGDTIGNRTDWTVTCDSEADEEHACVKTIDGNRDTHWLTARTASSRMNNITIDLGATTDVNGIAVLPRQDDTLEGNIANHEIYLSSDGTHWNQPIAHGTWWTDSTEKYSVFETTPARFVRLVALTDAMSTSWTAIAELNVFRYNSSKAGPESNTGSLGEWGPTMDLPIVPVTAFVDPHTDKVVLLSSKRHDDYPQDEPAWTLITVWDPTSGDLTQAKVKNTTHNMFCPGMAFDADGRLIVTGGASGTKTTIFNGSITDASFERQWQRGAKMAITRGYHSSVLMPDGRTFVLGGSWGATALVDPRQRNKIGEIYDPKGNFWTSLPLCSAEKLWTNDLKRDKKDVHLWLFAWKNDTVFQAGPSKNMSWYTVTGRGGWKAAGTRLNDDDAMCGESVMFDAVRGQILTFGGATSYERGGNASNSTFIMTLGEPNSTVKVDRVESMHYNRTFASAIVVPNGDVFVAGGQEGRPEVFKDKNPVFHPEIFSPKTGKWTTLAKDSIVRPYHSWTILLPDARIMNGGGGLCGDVCEANHFDAKIFTPPYLLTRDGRMASRPVITDVSAHDVKPGDTITITTDREIDSASLIRYSSTTHSVNTDQRRIPLALKRVDTNQYRFVVPAEGYIAIPGYWMLFVLDKEEVPSVSARIRVQIAE